MYMIQGLSCYFVTSDGRISVRAFNPEECFMFRDGRLNLTNKTTNLKKFLKVHEELNFKITHISDKELTLQELKDLNPELFL